MSEFVVIATYTIWAMNVLDELNLPAKRLDL